MKRACLLATDDVIGHLNIINLSLTLAAICLACAIYFRSLVAGILFALSGIAANFVAFLYMDVHNIGLTVDTLPVISLGIGLGVDYGVSTVARIRDEVVNGLTLDEAITKGLRSTGGLGILHLCGNGRWNTGLGVFAAIVS